MKTPRALEALALIVILGVFARSDAFAGIPDPGGTVPPFIYVVGFVGPGTPHPDLDGADGTGTSNLIVIRDGVGNPVANVGIHIRFPCDINLCAAVVDGQVVDCTDGTLNGVSDAQGRFSFVGIGAAKDPGTVLPCAPPGCVAPGGTLNSTEILIDGYAGTFKRTTAVALDQNGATGLPGTNGTTLGDASVLINLAGGYVLGGEAPSLYRGRGDINGDSRISLADVAAEIGHFGRIVLLGGYGCTATFCAKVPCP